MKTDIVITDIVLVFSETDVLNTEYIRKTKNWNLKLQSGIWLHHYCIRSIITQTRNAYILSFKFLIKQSI